MKNGGQILWNVIPICEERVQNRAVEQFVDVPVPKSHEKIVEVIQSSKS